MDRKEARMRRGDCDVCTEEKTPPGIRKRGTLTGS